MQNKLRRVRRAQDITQEKLAKISGISRVLISEIENGHSVNVRAQTLMKLARALGVKVTDIFFDDDVQQAEQLEQRNEETGD